MKHKVRVVALLVVVGSAFALLTIQGGCNGRQELVLVEAPGVEDVTSQTRQLRTEASNQTRIQLTKEQDSFYQILLKESFTALEGCEVYEPGSPGAAGAIIQPNFLDVALLTNAEKRMVGGWSLTSESIITTIDETLIAVSERYIETGLFPLDGAELFASTANAEHISRHHGSTEKDKLSLYRIGINQVTKKFYSSFTDDEWNPGGIFIEPATDEYIATNFAGWTANEGGPPHVFFYKLFGETPGSVLFEDTLVSGVPPR